MVKWIAFNFKNQSLNPLTLVMLLERCNNKYFEKQFQKQKWLNRLKAFLS